MSVEERLDFKESGREEGEEGVRGRERRIKPAAGAKILFLGPFQASWGNGTLENEFPASRSVDWSIFSSWATV